MNCSESIRLIHLNVGEELSDNERDQLLLHLSSCERCVSEARLAAQADHLMNIVRATPIIPDHDQLLRSILDLTAGEQKNGILAQLFDYLIDLFVRPGVRFAYGAFVIIIFSIFMLQQVDALRSVDELGSRFVLRTGPPMADVVFSLPLDDARNIVGADNFEPLIAATQVSLSDDRLRVHKSDLDPWSKSVPPGFLPRILASSAPDLERIAEALAQRQQSISSSFTIRIGGNDL